MAKQQHLIIPTERIERAIIVVRGEKVMLDSDLATFMKWKPKSCFAQFAGT
jgi:hypothetical protein